MKGKVVIMDVFKNKVVVVAIRIIVVIFLGLFILNISSLVMMFSLVSPDLLKSKPWLGGFSTHTTMLVLSVLIMLALSKGKIATYGFKLARNIQLKRIVLLSLVIGIIGTLIQSCIPREETAFSFLGDYSFIQIMIFVWIYASICEEVLTRGLIQGCLEPLTKFGFSVFKLHISLPVLISALFFAFMHIMLLTTGMGNATVFIIVLFAFILGIIAGYYRQKTESLIPAIIVHMFFNIGGTCAGLLTGLPV
ncbi:MAG: hypothetical protein B6D58_00175 [candidate division Zixibacteria bacterium 4484_95]|nr:MAG: hypothetical protein B6D58_00175 [candidate division Zixibacteria bacterium 4484_95]